MDTSLWHEFDYDLAELVAQPIAVDIQTYSRVYLAKLIDEVDQKIRTQLNIIIAHEDLQNLYMSWLGLHYLCQQHIADKLVQLKIFNVSWPELKKMVLKQGDYETSLLFNLVYSHEFDMPGGKPFGLLIGDYYIDIAHQADVAALENIGEVAAAAFVPFITSLTPAVFGIDHFGELDLTFDTKLSLEGFKFTQWQRFRRTEAARFISLVLPRVLYDAHHRQYFSVNNRWAINRTCWGHPGYALATVISRSYRSTGWFLAATGINFDANNTTGGVVPGILAPTFDTDQRPLVYKYATDVFLTESQERTLQADGFIAICQCRHTGMLIFNQMNNIKYSDLTKQAQEFDYGNANSLLYLLCVCRFAQYLKIIGREKIGALLNAQGCEKALQNWLLNYVATNTDISLEMKYRYPLQKAEVKINADAWQKNLFSCTIELCPHSRTMQTVASITLKTTIKAAHTTRNALL